MLLIKESWKCNFNTKVLNSTTVFNIVICYFGSQEMNCDYSIDVTD